MIHLPAARSARPRLRSILAAIVGVALVLPLILVAQAPEPAEAASGSDFNAGNIISDALFYDTSTMTVGQVQSFLESRVPNCVAGYTCLKDYRADSTYQPARSAGCAAYPGQANQSAAEIIWLVSTLCGINPQVMLVLLEKEQGLVSGRAPTEGIYRKATGFGCPDTAVCDSVYYGFFNQVYNAAYQYKKYQVSPGGRNFQAGRVNTIQWHPDAACGTSQVYIENQATAGLYIYTPYRPNSASLANMYGSGNGCSTYGNRNFFRIFTDWFGSTQGGGDFARTANDSSIWLLSGTTKFSVRSLDVFGALSNLGPHRIVSQSYLDSFATSPRAATALVRDPANGDVAVVVGGARHSFTDCALVASYGFACEAAIDLTASQLAKFPTSANMSPFFSDSAGTVYLHETGGRSPIATWDAVIALNRGVAPYVYPMPAAFASTLPILRTLVTPLTLVKAPESPSVFLIDGRGQKLPVSSFDIASEFGAVGYITVAKSVLDGYPTGPVLSQAVRCGEVDFIASQGNLRRLTSGWAAVGLLSIDLSMDSCARIPTGGAIEGQLFLLAPSGTVYGVAAGLARPVPSWSTLLALNSGIAPTLISTSAGSLGAIPLGATYIAPATLVRNQSNATIFFVDGSDRKIPVSSFTTAAALGVIGWSYTTDASLSIYQSTTGALTRAVRCAARDYFASNGKLYILGAGVSSGFAATSLTDGTCSSLAKGGGEPLQHIFVKSSDSGTVYSIEAGTRRPVGSWARLVELNGGPGPVILTEGANALSDIPVGPAA